MLSKKYLPSLSISIRTFMVTISIIVLLSLSKKFHKALSRRTSAMWMHPYFKTPLLIISKTFWITSFYLVSREHWRCQWHEVLIALPQKTTYSSAESDLYLYSFWDLSGSYDSKSFLRKTRKIRILFLQITTF